MPLRKTNKAAKYIVTGLKNQIIQEAGAAHHESFFLRKVDFLSFKKSLSINLYVEISRTYDFSRISSLLIRELDFALMCLGCFYFCDNVSCM